MEIEAPNLKKKELFYYSYLNGVGKRNAIDYVFKLPTSFFLTNFL